MHEILAKKGYFRKKIKWFGSEAVMDKALGGEMEEGMKNQLKKKSNYNNLT